MAENVTPPAPAAQAGITYRKISLVLLAIIAIMLVLWRPWEAAPGDNSRVITVTGETKLTAEPDEFVFSPNYEFKSANKDAALQQVSAKSTEVIAKLKELGVADSKIKSNTGGGERSFFSTFGNNETTYSLQFTITVNSRDQAQKVQDYLVTTSPTGEVSPQPNFSDAKRKELESKARDGATREARAKADQSAKNLGFKVGKVKSVEDGTGFGGPIRALAEGVASDKSPKLSVQPGQNELQYSVTVVYYVR